MVLRHPGALWQCWGAVRRDHDRLACCPPPGLSYRDRLPRHSPRDLHHSDLGVRHFPRFPNVRDSGVAHSPRLLNDGGSFVTHSPLNPKDAPRLLHHSDRGGNVSALFPNVSTRGVNVPGTLPNVSGGLPGPRGRSLCVTETFASATRTFLRVPRMCLGGAEVLANGAGTGWNVSRTFPGLRRRKRNVSPRLPYSSPGFGGLAPGRGPCGRRLRAGPGARPAASRR